MVQTQLFIYCMAHPVVTTGMIGLKYLQESDLINRVEATTHSTQTTNTDSVNKSEGATFLSGHP